MAEYLAVVFDGTASRPMGRYLSAVPEATVEHPQADERPPKVYTPKPAPEVYTPRQERAAQAHQRLREALQVKPQTTVELAATLGWSLWKTQSLLGRLRQHGRAHVIEQRPVHPPTFGRRYDAVWSIVTGI